MVFWEICLTFRTIPGHKRHRHTNSDANLALTRFDIRSVGKREVGLLRVKVYFLKGKPDPSEVEEAETIQRWMLNNLYDLVWEAELKNLVTPDIIASAFRAQANPFGIPFRKKAREISVGDIMQIGPTHYLVLGAGFREVEIR